MNPHRLRALIATSLALMGCEPYQEELPPPEWAQVTILNKSNELHQLTFYQPRASVVLDEAARQQVARGLSEAHFDLIRPISTISLYSGQEIGLGSPLLYHNESGYYDNGYRNPNIWLVKSSMLPTIIVAWDDRADKVYYRDVDVPQEVPADQGTVVIEADYSQVDPDALHPWRYTPCADAPSWQCDAELVEEALRVPRGARYAWRSQDAVALHRVASPGTTPRCEVEPPGAQIDWEVSAAPSLEVTRLSVGLDGCATVRGVSTVTDEASSWTLCAPPDMLELLVPKPDERVIATAELEEDPFNTYSSPRTLKIEIRRYVGDGVALRAHRLTLRQQARLLNVPRLDATLALAERGCAPTTSACRADLPAQLTIRDGQQTRTLSAGERLTLSSQAVTIYLASAGQTITRDLSCSVTEGLWMDVAFVEVLR